MIDTPSQKQLPLDILFLAVLVPAHMGLKGLSFLLVIPLFLYLGVAFWHPLTTYQQLPQQFGKARLAFFLRFFLLLLIITAATVVPTLTNIYMRAITPPDATGYSPTYAELHDGAIQVEYAVQFLDEGKNPYAERYEETPLRFYGFSEVEIANPAYDYFVYLPGFLVSSWPIYELFNQFDIVYDQRWLYLLAYILFVLFLPTLAQAPTVKLTILSAVALNPLLTGPVIIGMNDIMIILPLVLAVWAVHNKHFLFSAIAFGFACTLKQSAWFFAPFYLILLWEMVPATDKFKHIIKYLLVAGIIFMVIVLPFALWDWSAFFTDTFAYPGGSVDVNYPIRGYTVGVLLVGASVIASPLDAFPFWILQLAVGLPILIATLRYLWQKPTMPVLFVGAGMFIFGMGLVSRFFQDNYVGFVLTFVVLGLLLQWLTNET